MHNKIHSITISGDFLEIQIICRVSLFKVLKKIYCLKGFSYFDVIQASLIRKY